LLSFLSGLIIGHVRVLWPTSPHCLQWRLPSSLSFLGWRFGLVTMQVRLLWPYFPHALQTRLPFTDNLNILIIAFLESVFSQVNTLWPCSPQREHILRSTFNLALVWSISRRSEHVLRL